MGFMDKYMEAMQNAQKQYQSQSNMKQTTKSKFSSFFWTFLFFFSLAWLINVIFFSKPEQQQIQEQATENEIINISNVPTSQLSNNNLKLTIQGLRINNIELNKYKENKTDNKNITLLASNSDFMELGFLSNSGNVPEANSNWTIVSKDDSSIKLRWANQNGIIFNREVSISEDYLISIKDNIENHSNKDFSIIRYGRIVKETSADNTGKIGVFEGAIADIDSSIKTETFKSVSKKPYIFEAKNGFIGFTEQYWETILKLYQDNQTFRMKYRGHDIYQIDTQSENNIIKANESIEYKSNMFAGPKSQSLLSKLAQSGFTNLGSTIDYGWFFFLSIPFVWALIGLLKLVCNFGIAIIILTIIIRIIMYPLTRKSFESMANMKRLQPEMQKIQRLYPNDKMRQQQEIMALYQRLKINPMSGCLPMLLQIPIFFALYKALVISVDMRHAGFLWIPDLSTADPTSLFNLFGILSYSIPAWLPAMGLLPILMGLTMWWQQKIQNTNTTDKTPGMSIMKWLPAIFVLLFASLPAGLVLYWTVSNLLAIAQLKWMDYKAKKRL